MATKRKRRKTSISGYFKAIFAEQPRLLWERSNEALYQQWLADHPGQKEVPLRVKQGLSNVKSVLRSKGGPKQSEKALHLANGASHSPRRLPVTVLEKLELQIDECLSLARSANAEALSEVASDLRKARNAVVWKQGM